MSLEYQAALEGYEEWRPLACGYYEVSSFGRIRRSVAGNRTKVGRILKQQTSNKYNHVMLSLGHRRTKQFFVHVLVAEAFFGPKPTGMEVNHKDLDKRNNHADNLEYLTRLENMDHAIINNHWPTGERHGMARLSEEDVRYIRSQRGVQTRRQIASRFGINKDYVKDVWSHRVWRSVA